jgi:hypothetical protein
MHIFFGCANVALSARYILRIFSFLIISLLFLWLALSLVTTVSYYDFYLYRPPGILMTFHTGIAISRKEVIQCLKSFSMCPLCSWISIYFLNWVNSEVLSVLSEINYLFVNIYKQLTQDRRTVKSQEYFHLRTQE